MDPESIKIYSSRVLTPTEHLNFSFAYNMSILYAELIEEFSFLLSEDDSKNVPIQKLIDKYIEQKNKFSKYIDTIIEGYIIPTGYHMSCVEKVNIINEAPHIVEVFIKSISPNHKYNFKVNVDQFGYIVPENFFDIEEIEMIKKFEEICLDMILNENKLIFNMVELGSNQAYYSLLFHKILLKNNKIPVNVMIESNYDALQRGMKHFESNFCIGKFYNHIIGNIDTIKKIPELRNLIDSGVKLSTLSNILSKENIIHLDILHCDIDYSEYDMLLTSQEIFLNKQINYIFLATHGAELHQKCKKFLLECGYSIYFEHDDMENPIGWDTLLIMKS